MQKFLKRLVVEGGRVFWTAVEAASGILAAYHVPESLFDFAGLYEPYIVGAIGVSVAAAATWLKEKARKRLTETADADR